MGITSDDHGPVLADDPPDLVLDPRRSSSVRRAVEREVEAQALRRDERAGLPGPLADDVAQGAVEEVGAGVVAHRARPALGVDLGLDRVADRQPAVQQAALDDQAAGRDRPLGVGDLEEQRPPPGSRSTPRSPTWPPPSA